MDKILDSKDNVINPATSDNQTSGTQKSVSYIQDKQEGNDAFVDDFHHLRTSNTVKVVGTTFIGTTKDTNFWTETVTGTGSVTQGSGAVVLETGSTANSTVQYQSIRKAKFIPGQVNTYRFVGKLGDLGASNNVRRWGAFDSNNGVFFELNGTTLNLVTRANGSDTKIASSNWTTPFTLDTNIHSFEISMSYVKYSFYVDEIFRHKVDVVGSSSLSSQSLDMPATIQNNNSGGGTSDVTMTCFVNMIYRLGVDHNLNTYKHISNATTSVCKYGTGFLHNFIMNNPTNNSVTLYDSASTLTSTIAIINPGASATPFYLVYEVPFNNGLTIVTAGSPDLTISYE